MQNNPVSQPIAMFNHALREGWLHRLWANLCHRCLCLEDLDETLKSSEVADSHYAGVMTVAIDRIGGTEGKADEFDAEFNPIQERSRSRWVEIALQKLRGRDLPPVDLVQLDGTYYVRDGHHRISVSRAMGQSYIDAQVTIMHLQQHNMVR
jgi:hypothetical protein